MYERDRLKTRIWVQAQLRLCDSQGIPFVVRRRGDDDAGTVLLVIDSLDGELRVLSQTRTLEGELAWSEKRLASRDELDAHIERQLDFDPDIWVIEVEDAAGLYRVDGKVI